MKIFLYIVCYLVGLIMGLLIIYTINQPTESITFIHPCGEYTWILKDIKSHSKITFQCPTCKKKWYLNGKPIGEYEIK